MKEIDQYQLERIDAYLLHRMPDQERHQFETELDVNPALREAFEHQRAIADAIGYGQVQNALFTMYPEKGNNTLRKKRFWRTLSIAAALAAVTCVLYFLLSPPKYRKVFAEFYTADPGLPTLMGEDRQNYVFYQGMVDYKSGNDAAALRAWKSLVGSGRYPDTLTYYLAMASIGTGDYVAATDYLKQEPNGAFALKRKWYLALATLRQGDVAQARLVFAEIAQQPGPYTDRARALLDRINPR